MLLFAAPKTMCGFVFTYRTRSYGKYENNKLWMHLAWGSYNHFKWTIQETSEETE
jgi:hypothetical protein